MPLMKRLFPSRDLGIERPNFRASKRSSFASFASSQYDDDSTIDSDMEASAMSRARSKKKVSMPKVPAIPQRNSKRASTILNNSMPELKSMKILETTTEVVKDEEPRISDPHELYLSSEEDASLSDTDSLLDFSAVPLSEYNTPRSLPRASAEDTARVISFTLVSRPRVIEIPRPISFHSNTSTSNVSPINDYPTRHSVADIMSLAPNPSPLSPRRSSPRNSQLGSRQSSPLRKPKQHLSISSLAALSKLNTNHPNASTTAVSQKTPRLNSSATFLQPTSAVSNPSPQHAFLFSDPFPSPKPSPQTEKPSIFPEPEQNFQLRRPRSMHTERPKTPTSLMEGLQGLTRSFTKSAKKRPSMPKLNLTYIQGVTPITHTNTSRSSLTHSNGSQTSLLVVEELTPKDNKKGSMKRSSTVPLFLMEDGMKTRRTQETQSEIDEKAPVRYEDIIRTAIREPAPKTPTTPQHTSSPGLKGWIGMGMGNRRKSMKK